MYLVPNFMCYQSGLGLVEVPGYLKLSRAFAHHGAIFAWAFHRAALTGSLEAWKVRRPIETFLNIGRLF